MHKSYIRKFSLRFKKWSRKSYAAFKSVSRHVTIGCLKNIVADALLGKQKNILSIFTIAWKKENSFCDDEWHDPPDEELLSELFYLPSLQVERSYCGIIENPPNFYAWLKAVVYKRFQLFLFPYYQEWISPKMKDGAAY